MVLRLAAALDVPLRERNQLLMAAGLAPMYAERSLDDPEMAAVRDGVDRVLKAYDPFPCLAVDRGWNIVAANAGAAVMLDGVASHLLDTPNALRISLHPDGLAPRIRNLGQWRHHVIGRLRREVAVSGSRRTRVTAGRNRFVPRRFRRDHRSGRRGGAAGAVRTRRDGCCRS